MASAAMSPSDRKSELLQREIRILESLTSSAEDFEYIRDNNLFVANGFSSWPEYCHRRWGTTSDTLNKFIRHERVIDNVSDVTPKGVVLTQSAALEIDDLKPEQQREVAAALPAEKRKPSPADVRKARSDSGLPPKPKRSKLPKAPDANFALSVPESHQMPQDATEPPAAPRSNGRLFVVPAVDAAILTIEGVVSDAKGWDDPEAVARLVDEFRKAIRILSPDPAESNGCPIATGEMEPVVTAWNQTGNAACLKLTTKRKTAMRNRLKDPFWRENWPKAIEKVKSNPGGIKAASLGIDWFLRPDTVVKLIEGKYDTWRSGTEPATRALPETYGESGRL